MKHIPIAPTPGPPSSACTCGPGCAASRVIGAVLPVASLVNSELLHTWISELVSEGNDIAVPGVPNSTGITTV